MAPRGPVAILALVAVAALLTWAQVAIAGLTQCLNETPVLASGIVSTVPTAAWLARVGEAALAPFGTDAACNTEAPAVAMAIAGVAYVLGIILLDRGTGAGRLAWLLVIGVGVVARLAMFFMPALLSSDILDYASHGRVASIHHANPYLFVPSQFPEDPYSGLGAWAGVVTVYGPLWTRIDSTLTALLADASVVQVSFAYKLIGATADLLSAVLIVWIAVHWWRLGVSAVTPLVALAMWAWNPLVTLELVGSAHNEGLMIAFVLLAFALLTVALRSSTRPWWWLAALLSLWLAALIKFVPAAIEAIVALVWLRQAERASQRLLRVLILVACLAVIGFVVASPWLDSPAVAAPIVGLANGGQRVKDAWQDAPAAWLTVRVVPLLGVPDDPATLRMDVARTMVWGVTRTLFAAYVLFEGWLLWRRAAGPPADMLRGIAQASVRALLLALLLYTSQVYAWYFLWPLPVACLLGPRDAWSRAAVLFGLTFLPAFYLREFEPYGVFYMPIYAEVALALLGVAWIWTLKPRAAAQY